MHRIALLAPLALLVACTTSCQRNAPAATGAADEPGPAAAAGLVDPASGADCGGHDVRLTRDDFSVVLEGDCGEVTVAGSDGALNVTRARALRVEGDRVRVINERVDTVVVSGRDVTLNLTQAGAAEIGGSNNLLMGRDVARIRFTGNDNTANVNNTPVIEDSGRGNRVL